MMYRESKESYMLINAHINRILIKYTKHSSFTKYWWNDILTKLLFFTYFWQPMEHVSYLFSLGLKCHTFSGFSMTRDCWLYHSVRLVRINIRQYDRYFAYSSRHFRKVYTKTVFRKFSKCFELLQPQLK